MTVSKKGVARLFKQLRGIARYKVVMVHVLVSQCDHNKAGLAVMMKMYLALSRQTVDEDRS